MKRIAIYSAFLAMTSSFTYAMEATTGDMESCDTGSEVSSYSADASKAQQGSDKDAANHLDISSDKEKK